MAVQEEKNTGTVTQVVETGEKKKKTAGAKFLSFLMYGGWLLILILIVGIVMAVSILTGGK